MKSFYLSLSLKSKIGVKNPPEEPASGDRPLRVPEDIRPRMAGYRLEVVFWGVRDMRRCGLVPVLRPKIVVECAGAHLESQVMENARRFANFRETRVTIDLVSRKIPENPTTGVRTIIILVLISNSENMMRVRNCASFWTYYCTKV